MDTSRRKFLAGLGTVVAATSISAVGSTNRGIEEYSKDISHCVGAMLKRPMTKESIRQLNKELHGISREIVDSGICSEYMLEVDDWFSLDGETGVVRLVKHSRRAVDDELVTTKFSVAKYGSGKYYGKNS